MNVTVADSEKMVSDIDGLEAEIRGTYERDGKPVPSDEQLRRQATCVWTYMTIRGVLEQAQAAAAAQITAQRQQATLAARKPPTIVGPNGRRLV